MTVMMIITMIMMIMMTQKSWTMLTTLVMTILMTTMMNILRRIQSQGSVHFLSALEGVELLYPVTTITKWLMSVFLSPMGDAGGTGIDS